MAYSDCVLAVVGTQYAHHDSAGDRFVLDVLRTETRPIFLVPFQVPWKKDSGNRMPSNRRPENVYNYQFATDKKITMRSSQPS